jgi:hypothetical protein
MRRYSSSLLLIIRKNLAFQNQADSSHQAGSAKAKIKKMMRSLFGKDGSGKILLR